MIWSRKLLTDDPRPAGPRGHRAYAVGDIHGRLDLLDQLLRKIETDNAARPKAKTTIVFLGDLVDRGPQSAQVVERLRLYRPEFATTVFLMGNHEEVLLRVMAGETGLLRDWLKFGGAECLCSYGVEPSEVLSRDARAALELMRGAIPKEHLDFIGSFVDSASFGRYLFVHAGIRPGVPLAEQASQDLRWIRLPFLDDPGDHGHVVVHGHTISEQVENRHNRIGLDTGAYRTGVLTTLGIEGGERWLLQTDPPPADSSVSGQVANVTEAY